MKKFLLSGISGLLLVFAAFGLVVTAQSDEELLGGTGFRVTDPTKSVTVNPGQSIVENVSLRNVTEDSQTAEVIFEDFTPPQDESGSPQIIAQGTGELTPYSIIPFISPIADFTLESGEEREIPISVSIPEDANPGGYFGVIRFESTNEADIENETSEVALNASVGVIFLINVPGDTVDLLSLEQIGAARDGEISSVFSQPPDTIVLRLRNEGNTIQVPFGGIQVVDWSGNQIIDTEFNNQQEKFSVLPDSIRRFDIPADDIGSFGRYKVTGFISYGDGTNIIELNSTFWVIPWITIAILAGIVIVIAFIATRGIKRYNQYVLDKSKGTTNK